MVILHDAMYVTQNGVFVLFFNNKNVFLFKKTKNGLKNKENRWISFLQKTSFSIIFQSLCDFPLIARFGTSHVNINLI